MDFTTAQAILLVIQILIGIIVMAGVPWAMKVSSRLAAIEAGMSNFDRREREGRKTHDTLFQRVRTVESRLDQCPNCPKSGAVAKVGEG